LNFDADMSSLGIGFCALQVGHQEAWIATKIGLPALCAAAKASGSYALVSAAKLGVLRIPLAEIAAKTTDRRESMA
jgi:hypothetical protein